MQQNQDTITTLMKTNKEVANHHHSNHLHPSTATIVNSYEDTSSTSLAYCLPCYDSMQSIFSKFKTILCLNNNNNKQSSSSSSNTNYQQPSSSFIDCLLGRNNRNYSYLLDIVISNDTNKLKSFMIKADLKEFNDLCTRKNPDDVLERTILHYVALNKDYVNLLEIILTNVKEVDIIDKYGVTPLISAITGSNMRAIRLLLSNGANVNSCDVYGWSTLHEATNVGDYDVLQFLLDHGGNINIKDRDNKTLLHIACDNGDVDIVKLLYNYNIDIEACDKWGWTGLHIASGHNELEIVKYLISKNANINALDMNGQRAIDWANNFNANDVFKYLTNITNLKLLRQQQQHPCQHDDLIVDSNDSSNDDISLNNYNNDSDDLY